MMVVSVPANGSSALVPAVTRRMAQTPAPTTRAISRQVRRIGSRAQSRSSLAATAPAGVRGSNWRPVCARAPGCAGWLAAVMRLVSTAGQARTASTSTAARPRSGRAVIVQSARAAAATASGAQPEGSARSASDSHGAERSRSAVISVGASVPATASRLMPVAVTIVPASRPRREPGARSPPARIERTPVSSSDSRTPATPASAAARPACAPEAISAPSAIASNASPGSSRPTASSAHARRRRRTPSSAKSSGRRVASPPTSTVCAQRPASHSAKSRARTSVATSGLP